LGIVILDDVMSCFSISSCTCIWWHT